MSEPSARTAAEVLPEIAKGTVMAELTEALHAATQAVRIHNKKATVTLTVTVEPFKEGTQGIAEQPLLLSGEVEAKLPKTAPERSLFFPDVDGNLNKTPQRQADLGLRVGVDKKE